MSTNRELREAVVKASQKYRDATYGCRFSATEILGLTESPTQKMATAELLMARLPHMLSQVSAQVQDGERPISQSDMARLLGGLADVYGVLAEACPE